VVIGEFVITSYQNGPVQPVCDFFNIPIDQDIRSSDQTKTYHMLRGRHGHDGMVAGLKKNIQSVPITTEVVRSMGLNPDQVKYTIKLVCIASFQRLVGSKAKQYLREG
jgi:hypothetical protein